MIEIVFIVKKKIKRVINWIINYIKLHVNRIEYGENFEINGCPLIVGNVKIGSNCRINSGQEYNPIGGDSKTTLIAYKGKITIGNNVGLSNVTIVSQEEITIEDDVRIGGSVKIYDTDFHSLDLKKRLEKVDHDVKKKPIIIKKGVFIGAHSIILKGVTIGRESVVGAGSVVRTSIPAGEIWAGNPATFIRKNNEGNYEDIMVDKSGTS